MILEQIKGPEDLKKLTSEELSQLAEEIRAFLIEKISHTGGHLASNLGVVELTIALFRTFDLPEDKIIWDVGHQSYTHKILSGRRMEFDELRQYGGLSGFPKRKESPYDSFDTGHSTLERIPVVGGRMIDKIKRTKNSIKQLFIPGMLFENMGITYLGPVDGHNIPALCKVLKEAQKLDHAVLVHVLTKKGKGYEPAEKNPAHFHGVSPFDIKTGKPLAEKKYPTYTDVFSKKLCQLGETHPELVAVTAAMPDGTGVAAFGKKFPDRFFDVGIAEAHAVTSAAGMAAAGLRPVVAVYSSFLQRGYDQILHDVCIQNLPVLFAVDRAGLVGSDGETHQGIFDYSYLTSIPNMSVAAPKNLWELRAMLDFAMDYKAPFAIRYPRGTAYRGLKEFMQPIAYGKGEIIYEEENIALLAVGSMVSTGEHVRAKLKEEGVSCTLANARFVKPFDKELVDRLAKNHRLIVTMEENVLQGGFGLPVTAYIHEHYPQVKVMNIALPDAYVEHGNVSVLRKGLGIDSDSIIQRLKAEGWL